MKKYSILLLVLFLGFLINCSKDSASDDSNGQEVVKILDKTPNLKATGDSANDILSNDNFTKLRIEIGHVVDFKPTEEAIANFVAFLRTHTFKQDIEVIYKELPSPEKDKLTLQEVGNLEIENRTAYNDGDILAIYIYFADAPSDEDVEDEGLVTLGAVYRNTSMIIYEATIRKLTARSRIITTADVETGTLNHEFGHLFGLVNLGTTPVNPSHEDNEAPNHCNVVGCLMRAELQFGNSMKRMLEAKNGLIPDLDPECIADLRSNGGR